MFHEKDSDNRPHLVYLSLMWQNELKLVFKLFFVSVKRKPPVFLLPLLQVASSTADDAN